MDVQEMEKDQRMKLANDHYNQGVLAGEKQIYDRAIQEFDMALKYDPLPDLKMCIYLNYAISIWLKNNFPNRDGSTISDEEYEEVKRILSFYKEVMSIYEGLDEKTVLKSGLPIKQVYDQAKNNYNAAVPYGITRRSKDGKFIFRDEKPETQQKKGGCFIATAAFGDPFAKEIIILSKFRDEILQMNRVGRIFIKLYYKFSPTLAKFISDKSSLRWLMRTFLIRPLADFLAYLFD